MRSDQLKVYLDKQVELFNQPDFIPLDPISIPHQFNRKQDIEISGLIAAVFAWGNRLTIRNKSLEFLGMMDGAPYEFLINHKESDLKPFDQFRHRTFQPLDALYFIDFLTRHYKENESLEELFLSNSGIETGLVQFHTRFFAASYAPNRTRKHIPDPRRGSTCKRLNMFLRWMVRKDNKGVDFGIWKKINQADLICPIDVHVGKVSRELGLLKRKQTDWRAAIELTENLRKLDPNDPVKYDFALFGLGVNAD